MIGGRQVIGYLLKTGFASPTLWARNDPANKINAFMGLNSK